MRNIKIELLMEFKNHPFESYDDGALQALAHSIQSIGLQNPIIVRQIPDSEQYEIIAGHNRVRACKLLRKKVVLAIIKNVDDALAKLIMAETNLKQRERMKPSEKIRAYALEAEALTSQGKLTGTTKRAELSKMFGESGKQVERYLHLSKLATPLLKLLDQRKLSQKDGLALAKLPPDDQMAAYENLASAQLSNKKQPEDLCYPIPLIADFPQQRWLFEEFLGKNTNRLSCLMLSEIFNRYDSPVHIAIYHRGQVKAYSELYDLLLCAGLVDASTYATGKAVGMDMRNGQKDKSKIIVTFYGNIDDIMNKPNIEQAVLNNFQQSHMTLGFAETVPDKGYLFSQGSTHILLCTHYFEQGNFIGLMLTGTELYQYLMEVAQP